MTDWLNSARSAFLLAVALLAGGAGGAASATAPLDATATAFIKDHCLR